MMKMNKHKIRKYICLLILSVPFLNTSCSDFLDIVPDNVATIDHAFNLSVETEKYLFTCYSYLPKSSEPYGNVGLLAGDEFWLTPFFSNYTAATWSTIARGRQNADYPAANYWNGENEGVPLFAALRHCNVFLENVEDLSKVKDLTLDKRKRWIAEVKFLKAYYHFYLLRMYGPIPLIKKNLPLYVSKEEAMIKRRPVDECVNYIESLLDESYPDLPSVINNKTDEMGRITKSINRAIKAKLLLMAASPLFNGNPDYSNFSNKDGKKLFSNKPDSTKWEKAADAALKAIEEAESAGHKLYYYTRPDFEMSDTTMTQMSIRGALTEPWNDEVIWGLSSSRAHVIQRAGMTRLTTTMGQYSAYASLAPTLKIVQQFYSHHGVPIEEDKLLDFSDINQLRVAKESDRVNFEVRYTTARINFDRENRFYACVGFDGGKWLMADLPARRDYDAYVAKAKLGQISSGDYGISSETGYFCKKVVNWASTFTANSSIKEYPWPEIRLADLYLMYAEALNEAEGPVDDVHEYLNRVRTRAGLKSVEYSWTEYSTNPEKPTTQPGMREIIHRERLIEMAFEGSRFWDLRRWKKASSEINKPVTGWTISQKEALDYYQIRTIFNQKFVSPRDYLWPVRLSELSVNDNLVQNPGW